MSDHLERLEQVLAVNGPSSYAVAAMRLDLRALCDECRRLRADVAALEGLFADLHTDDAAGRFAAGVAHGAARQLAEVLRIVTDWEGLPRHAMQAKYQTCNLPAMLRDLGPVRPPLPAERLAAENSELRVAALRLLSALSGVPSDIPGATAELRRLLKLPAA